jgi:hypothetical protein
MVAVGVVVGGGVKVDVGMTVLVEVGEVVGGKGVGVSVRVTAGKAVAVGIETICRLHAVTRPPKTATVKKNNHDLFVRVIGSG